MSDSLIYRILWGISGLVVGILLQFLASQSAPPSSHQLEWFMHEIVENPDYFGMWQRGNEDSSISLKVDSENRVGIFRYGAFINTDKDTVLLIHFQY